jgi:two-component system sensor histidine kinase KdpD
MTNNGRPDPDQLLARVQEEEAKAARGKLKIFFGASAGVGKTYAMLGAARRQKELGSDVVIGVVETHGRKETEALITGLERLPLCEIPYRGSVLKEFDLDAALARRPALILMDELAHSNVAGSRHPKRWQDIHDLLVAGIDVYSTVNVQHLETLNDVVSGIAGIRVWETVPDRIFDEADEVVLVDLPPDDLLQRLKEGKVYLPQQAERAIRNFFRKGNLIALRELALRRTADRVDDEMLAYRRETSVATVWQTRDALLVCIGSGTGAERLVRTGARLAGRLEAPWHTIHVHTQTSGPEPEVERQRIVRALELSASLGAETATLSADDPVTALVDYAREQNLSRLLVGRDHPRPWRPWYRSMADRIGQAAPDLDVIQVARNEDARAAASPSTASPNARQLAGVSQGSGNLRRGHGAGNAACRRHRTHQHCDAVPACGAHRGHASWPRPGGRQLVSGGCRLRLLLRGTAFFLRRQRCSVSDDLRRYAQRGAYHRPAHRALQAARRRGDRARSARPRALRNGTGSVGSSATDADRRGL